MAVVRSALASASPELRVLSLRLLDATSRLRKEQVEELIGDDESPEVRMTAAELAVKRRWRLSEEQIDAAVKDLSFSMDRERDLYRAYFGQQPPERLAEEIDWHRVRSYRIYEALACDHFEVIADWIDTDLDEDFARLKQRTRDYFRARIEADLRSKYGPDALETEDLSARVERALDRLVSDEERFDRFMLGQFRAAAMAGIAEHGSDAQLRHALCLVEVADSQLLVHCLAIIRRCGGHEQVSLLVRIAAERYGEARDLAARAALELSDDVFVTAKDLIATEDTSVVWIALEAIAGLSIDEVFNPAYALLRSDSLGTRNVATEFLIEQLSRKQLRALPSFYSRGQYYYSVPVLVDRHLYAPPALLRAIRALRGH